MGKAENYVEQYLKKQAEKKGFLVYKFVSPGNNGVPDRILIGHGKTIFVETKAPKAKARTLQIAVHKLMQNHGADVRLIDTREKVDEFLTCFEK